MSKFLRFGRPSLRCQTSAVPRTLLDETGQNIPLFEGFSLETVSEEDRLRYDAVLLEAIKVRSSFACARTSVADIQNNSVCETDGQ